MRLAGTAGIVAVGGLRRQLRSRVRAFARSGFRVPGSGFRVPGSALALAGLCVSPFGRACGRNWRTRERANARTPERANPRPRFARLREPRAARRHARRCLAFDSRDLRSAARRARPVAGHVCHGLFRLERRQRPGAEPLRHRHCAVSQLRHDRHCAAGLRAVACLVGHGGAWFRVGHRRGHDRRGPEHLRGRGARGARPELDARGVRGRRRHRPAGHDGDSWRWPELESRLRRRGSGAARAGCRLRRDARTLRAIAAVQRQRL